MNMQVVVITHISVLSIFHTGVGGANLSMGTPFHSDRNAIRIRRIETYTPGHRARIALCLQALQAATRYQAYFLRTQ